MHECKIKIFCKNPSLIKKSLEPDIKESRDLKIKLTSGKGWIGIEVKSSKLSHLKAVINSYISLIQMLEKVDKIE